MASIRLYHALHPRQPRPRSRPVPHFEPDYRLRVTVEWLEAAALTLMLTLAIVALVHIA